LPGLNRPQTAFISGGLSGEHDVLDRTSMLKPKLGPDALQQSIRCPYPADKKMQFQ
jgi:hypothetical protein